MQGQLRMEVCPPANKANLNSRVAADPIAHTCCTRDPRWHDTTIKCLPTEASAFADTANRRQEIQDETDREAAGKAISDNPIRLRICSPNVLTMTVRPQLGAAWAQTPTRRDARSSFDGNGQSLVRAEFRWAQTRSNRTNQHSHRRLGRFLCQTSSALIIISQRVTTTGYFGWELEPAKHPWCSFSCLAWILLWVVVVELMP